VQEIASKLNGSIRDVMYVGDSITDVQSFQLVKENGGLTISFNGNEYAIREAEVAVLSNNTIVTSVLADAFSRFGKEQVIRLIEEWSHSGLKKYCADRVLLDHMFELYPKTLPRVEIITTSNKERLMKESSAFRKTVRGEAIGRLG